MPAVTCYLAELKVPANVALESNFTLQGFDIPYYFNQASALPGGGEAIDLRMDSSQRHLLPTPASFGTCDVALQSALTQIFKTVGPSASPGIGLIIADIYTAYTDAYGCMFDFDGNFPNYGPRQGCALFASTLLGAIQQIQGSARDFQDFLTYTAIHELGHAFNLWHVDPASFMVATPDAGSFGQNLAFVDEEKNYLKHGVDGDNGRYVLPGQSAFNDRGPLAPAINSGGLMRAPIKSGIRLKISMSQDEFFYFEPVELDVRITCGGTETIPDRVDPSHETFAIWITKPDGERFRYRPGKSVCAPMKHRTISRRSSFQRDISIFRQGCGFTFSTPGCYKVQLVFELSKNLVILSNEICCEVKKPNPSLKLYSEMKRAFSSMEAIRFLRYKRLLPSKEVIQNLEQFAESNRSAPSAAAVHYALGRAFLMQAKEEAKADHAQELRTVGISHFQKARDLRKLSKHRQFVLERILGF